MKRPVFFLISVLFSGVMLSGVLSCGKDGGDSNQNKKTPNDPPTTPIVVTKGIYIPDAKLKAALTETPSLRKIDANGDKEISIAEAEAVTSLELKGRGIKDLTGLEYFKNLTSLYLDNNELTTLEKHITPLTKLRTLSVPNCGLKGELNLTSLVKLETCRIVELNTYTAIKVHSEALAKKLNILERTAVYYAGEKPDIIYFKDIDLENAFLGAGADLNGDGKITIAEAKTFSGTIKVGDVGSLEDLMYFDALEGIEVNGTGAKVLKEVEIKNLVALKYIVIRNMGVEKLTVENLRNLEVLNLVGNLLRSFTVSGMPKLRELILRERNLRELNIPGTGLPSVKSVNLMETQLSGSIDLRNFTELEPDKVYIKRENGTPNVTHIRTANSSLAKQLNEAELTDVYTTGTATENVSVQFNDLYMKFAVALLLNKTAAVDARNLESYQRRNNDPNLTKLVITKLDMENFTGTIKLDRRGITNLSGIENFINASSLELNGVEAKSLDISKLVNLERLVLASTFTSVKVGNLPKLSDVTVSYDASGLDFRGCKNLKRLVINFSTLNIECILVPENLVTTLRDSSPNLKERIKAKCE